MDMGKMMNGRPRVAVIDPNMLAILGLKNILQNVMPIIEVEAFSTFDDFFAANPDLFFHFFAAQTIVLENRAFFTERRQKTILLTISKDPNSQLSGFHSICVNVSEEELVRSLLTVEQHGHAGGRNLPEMPQVLKNKILSNREIEVLSLVVQGYINKEVAIKLGISLTTVITHRKNIMEKLGMKSVSALTIYAIMNGYVDINKI
ncbi:helix-turn-helix transcriptional regulator [Prevotella falsenii]|uniref:helix-turn-helix transcriptional regulator n=1 Tax=Prevotella falsenii TaxID=515414 RepID=UPI000468A3AF|nr:LuxR C-terminal-related transcriptional regulator [Prevotella falsenii]